MALVIRWSKGSRHSTLKISENNWPVYRSVSRCCFWSDTIHPYLESLGGTSSSRPRDDGHRTPTDHWNTYPPIVEWHSVLYRKKQSPVDASPSRTSVAQVERILCGTSSTAVRCASSPTLAQEFESARWVDLRVAPVNSRICKSWEKTWQSEDEGTDDESSIRWAFRSLHHEWRMKTRTCHSMDNQSECCSENSAGKIYLVRQTREKRREMRERTGREMDQESRELVEHLHRRVNCTDHAEECWRTNERDRWSQELERIEMITFCFGCKSTGTAIDVSLLLIEQQQWRSSLPIESRKQAHDLNAEETMTENSSMWPPYTPVTIRLNFLRGIFALIFHLSFDKALHRHKTVGKRMARRSTLVVRVDEEFGATMCFR